MNLLYIWIYTLILVFVWWFFIVAKLHSYKFKNFSHNIEKVTTFLLIVLIILSILWYVVLFFWNSLEPNTASLLDSSKNTQNSKSFDNLDFEEINY